MSAREQTRALTRRPARRSRRSPLCQEGFHLECSGYRRVTLPDRIGHAFRRCRCRCGCAPRAFLKERSA